MSRAARLTLAFLAAGLVVGLAATVGAMMHDEVTLRLPTPALAAAALGVAVFTALGLLARFMRWQLVLRRLGARLPTIPSLSAFIGSFAFLPVPLYAGQLIARSQLLPAHVRPHATVIVLAFLWERALDVWSLALLASLAFSARLGLLVGIGTGLALVPALRQRALRGAIAATGYLWSLVSPAPLPLRPESFSKLIDLRVLGAGAAASMAAWLPLVLSACLLGWASGVGVEPLGWTAATARSILLGVISLVPVGSGVMGLTLLRDLDALGVDAADSTQIVFLYRVATAWLTVALGGLGLLFALRTWKRPAAQRHFDEIDACYDAWLAPHYRLHLVRKKTDPILSRLPALGGRLRGLDVGCGRGWYLRELESASDSEILGLDLSQRQLAATREYVGDETSLVQGSVNALPFAAKSFDFAYIVNVLHHVPSPAEQVDALRGLASILRPGGLLFLHEMNVRNLLFRWYLCYAYPILKGIDEGTEYYLDPRRLPEVPELELRETEYFTFTPDFVPLRLLPFFSAVEKLLEKSAIAPYAAHFLAVLERKES